MFNGKHGIALKQLVGVGVGEAFETRWKILNMMKIYKIGEKYEHVWQMVKMMEHHENHADNEKRYAN